MKTPTPASDGIILSLSDYHILTCVCGVLRLRTSGFVGSAGLV